MAVFDRHFKDMFSSELISIFGGLLAGTLLAAYTDKLLLIPGMLILLPGFLEMRGNISGSLAARLSSGLYLGVVDKTKFATKIVRGNFDASFILALSVSFVLGLISFAFNLFLFSAYTPQLIAIPVLAGLISNGVEIPISLYFTFYLFRKGHDPDSIMGPFVTSTGDITSIVSLLVAMAII